MNWVLLIAAGQQLLLALLFFVIPFVALRYGQRAQSAAEREVNAQGLEIDAETLWRSGAQFSESRTEMLLPLGIGMVLLATATLAIIGGGIAVIVTGVVELLLLAVVGFVTHAQVFPASYLRRAWAEAKDQRLRQINIDRMIHAATGEFPPWLRPLVVTRFGLATFGSTVVLILLAMYR